MKRNVLEIANIDFFKCLPQPPQPMKRLAKTTTKSKISTTVKSYFINKVAWSVHPDYSGGNWCRRKNRLAVADVIRALESSLVGKWLVSWPRSWQKSFGVSINVSAAAAEGGESNFANCFLVGTAVGRAGSEAWNCPRRYLPCKWAGSEVGNCPRRKRVCKWTGSEAGISPRRYR